MLSLRKGKGYKNTLYKGLRFMKIHRTVNSFVHAKSDDLKSKMKDCNQIELQEEGTQDLEAKECVFGPKHNHFIENI